VGQFVLGHNNVIGTISKISSYQGQVRLVTDPASKIAVKIAGSVTAQWMKGTGSNTASVQMIKQKVKISSNVFADKNPGFLDAPMIVGKVVGCRPNAETGLLWDVTVEPACDIEELKDVAVIIINP